MRQWFYISTKCQACDFLSNATHLDCHIPIQTLVSQKSLGCLMEYLSDCFRSLDQKGCNPQNKICFIMPPPFIMGGAYSITLVRTYVHTYVHTYVRTYVRPVRTKNGFRVISFKYIGLLDSYFIHRYISIKYRSSSITDKIHRLLSELWPLISE